MTQSSDNSTPNDNAVNAQLLHDAALQLRSMREQLEARDRAEHEAIAIIGMACRFPGGANNPQAFWQLLQSASNAASEVPAERWDINAFYDADPEAPGRMYTRHANFIDDVDRFDPGFFGISPREALHLDPQQRLLLECACHALEDAGIPIDTLRGSNTGVYIGLSLDDYAQRSVRSGDASRIDAHSALGSQRAIAAGRIAYTLGLQGPAMQLDTTCSSSLVSVHLACQALRRGETSLALAGGVNLILAPEASIACCKLKALSSDGVCRTFSDDAQGYGRGEGCGLLVMKALVAAQADGDNILAVIRGSAINHDGTSNGLTAPNGEAQIDVIQAALNDADLKGNDIDVIEAHGTGTPLGDPIELEALHAALGKRDKDLIVASVKTNIGHLEAAAGIAGLIKLVLSMQHHQLPAHLHCETPSTRVDWQQLGMTIPHNNRDWPTGEQPHRAGISSFGLSGTNAHIILESYEQADTQIEIANIENDAAAQLLSISARNTEALNALVSAYANQLSHDDIHLAALCNAANTGRSHYAYRCAVVADTAIAMQQQLNSFASSTTKHTSGQRIVFLYTGQGAQYLEMGRGLYESEAVFRDVIDTCDRVLDGLLPQSLKQLLYPLENNSAAQALLSQTSVTQPACFALQYALTQLWASWGIRPDAVIGHSVGEFAAACCAGVMEWMDGLALIAQRARLMQAMPAGAMLAVQCTEQQAQQHFGDTLDIAVINGRERVVIAGEQSAINDAQTYCQENAIASTQLEVSHAFHSSMMRAVEKDFQHYAEAIDFQAPDIKWYSTVTGKQVNNAISASHWVTQLCSSVRFADALQQLGDCDATDLVEIGPKATLLAMAQENIDSIAACLPSLKPAAAGQQDRHCLLRALSQLYMHGHNVDWQTLSSTEHNDFSLLPKYPFADERYWLDIPARSIQDSSKPATVSALPGRDLGLAGERLHGFELTLSAMQGTHWSDHVINEQVLWPAAAYIATAVAAYANIKAVDNEQAICLRDLRLRKALWLPEDVQYTLQTQLRQETDGSIMFEMLSHKSDHKQSNEQNPEQADWQTNASGCCDSVAFKQYTHETSLNNDFQPMSAESLYTMFSTRRMDYGPSYRLIKALQVSDNTVVASLNKCTSAAPTGHIDVCVLDAGLQAAGALLSANDETRVPVGVDAFTVYGDIRDAEQVVITRNGKRLDCLWLTAEGQVLIQLDGLRTQALIATTTVESLATPCITTEWQQQPLVASNDYIADSWAIINENAACQNTDNEGFVNELATQLQASIANDNNLHSLLNETQHVAIVLPAITKTTDITAATHHVCRTVFDVAQQLIAREQNNKLPGNSTSNLCIICTQNHAADQLVSSSVQGMLQSLSLEQQTLQPRYICGDNIAAIATELQSMTNESRVQLFAGQRKVARLQQHQLETQENSLTRLKRDSSGAVDGLHWQTVAADKLDDNSVELKVLASGVNFRDVMIAMGLYPGQAELGCECIGEIIAVGKNVERVTVGDRVMAIGAHCFADRVVVPQALVSTAPDAISDEQAATLPVAFATAAHALLALAKLKAGDSVLIHSATGGVGQAAMQIAKQCGATIYASASQSKWQVLKQFGIDDPLDSRDPQFAERLLELTQQRGVDVVLNSLPGEMRQRSLDVVANNGSFIEIGKGDGITPEDIQRQRPDVNHHVFDLGALSEQAPDAVTALLQQIHAQVTAKHWQTLPVTAYAASEVIDAFRHMQSAKHLGKLVILPPSSSQFGDGDDVAFANDAAYLITGGFGALGLSVANWMVERGARHLLLLGRNIKLDAQREQALQSLREQGVTLHALQADVADHAQLKTVLSDWTDDDADIALRGVVHAAGVLDDATIDQLNWQQYEKVFAPKVNGSWNLHQVTQSLSLDFFVMFSSAAGVFGAPGQTNYGAANRFLDGLASYRASQGLPALSIAWGPWSEIGVALKYARDNKLRLLPGIGMFSPARALLHLERVWKHTNSNIAVIDLDSAGFSAVPGIEQQALFSELLSSQSVADDSELLQQLAQTPAEQRRTVLDAHITSAVAQVLGFDTNRLDVHTGLFDLGLDSLTALELKNSLQRDLGMALPTTLLFDYPTVAALLEHLAQAVLRDELATSNTASTDTPNATNKQANIATSNTNIDNENLADALDDKLDELDALFDDASEQRI